jgi:hypothetical protein
VVDGQLEEVIRPRPVDLLVHPHATSVVFYRRAAEGRRSRTGRSAESGSNCEARGVVRSGRTVTRLRPEVDVADADLAMTRLIQPLAHGASSGAPRQRVNDLHGLSR